ncbi:MAG: prepilin-type N-terminal cleavage/methylation domain-containing protein [Nitrospirae bacterium YQR-1]
MTSMGTVEREKGFTLIEVAIVLVIIGIIIGAIMKGQDLMDNARGKRFGVEIHKWESAIYAYLDIKGNLPGDGTPSGLIGSGSGNPQTDISNANFQNPPNNSFVLGPNTYYVYLGSDSTSGKNYLIACKSSNCGTALTYTIKSNQIALKFFSTYDTSIDGSSDAGAGKVAGISAAPTIANNSFTSLTVLSATTNWTSVSTIFGMAYELN